MKLGRISKDAEVRLKVGDDGSPTLRTEARRLNSQALETVYGKMNRNPTVLFRWMDTKLLDDVTTDAADVMYTSVPYDRGWIILVDGKAAASWKMLDTFLAVNISEGTRRISFSYEPEGFGTETWITRVSTAVLGVTVLAGVSRRREKDRAINGYSIRKNRRENKKSQKEGSGSKQENRTRK